MIKIFDATDRDFSTAGNIIIEPIKCIEYKKKSLNGWFIEVEMPIKYKEYITKDKLCVIKTKSKLRPQAFRIGENIKYTTKKIKFTANHVMFDAKDYILLDVRPTNQNGINALNYINERTDNISPFFVYSNVENINTAYFIRKNLLEAWAVLEERWGGVFDADNWDISFLTSVGNDNGETIRYGQDMQGFDIFEDWSSVCTKICPVGYDGIMLPETYLESDIQYEKPYTKVIDFQTNLEGEEQNKENLILELRKNAKTYLEENKYPKVSYTVISNIKQTLEIGDIIKVSHPFVELFTEVLEYEYNLVNEKVISLTFGNYSREVKTKFDNIKNSIVEINHVLSKQEIAINTQTNLINTLNKNGYVYIDDNEILVLDKLPKEEAKNVWRFGLGGLGFSSNGYEGPFELAMTMDGQINANFITTGTLNVSRIEGLSDNLASIEIEMGTITQTVGDQNQKIAQVTQTVNEITSKISDIADITMSKESTNAVVTFEGINQSEPIYINIRPIGCNISYLYPRDNLFPSDDLFMPDRIIRFTNTTTKETWDYELPDNLLIYDSENYDEFFWNYDDQSIMINRKCGFNADGTVRLLDKMVTTSYAFPKIELTDGDYKVELPGYSNAYLFVRLMAQNIYTTQFATNVQVKSQILQTVNSINLSVDQKLSDYSTTTQMNAAISVKANEITNSVSKTYATKDALNSEVKTINSKITQTADSIISTVSETYETKDNATTNYSKLTQTANSLQSQITDNKNNISTIQQTVNEVNIEVGKKYNTSDFTNAKITAKINDGTSSVLIKASRIDLSGYLTVSSAKSTYATQSGLSGGTTTINGNCITTGTIDASKVTVKNLNASNITSGTISASKINGGTITASAINLGNGKFAVTTAGALTATNATISGKITATSGKIGGFTIESNTMVASGTNCRVYVSNASNSTKDFLVVETGNSTSGYQWPFVVRGDGSFYATKATIGGTITAGNGSTIGGLTMSNGILTCARLTLDALNGSVSIFNGAGGSMILSNAARLSATAGIGISSNSNGSISAPTKNIDIKACSGANVYIGSMSNASGTTERACVSVENGLLAFRSSGYATYNGSTIWGSSSKATKENITELTQQQKTTVYMLLKNIPLMQYDYKKEYSGQKNNYGFLIEDIENTDLKTLLHISQSETNEDIKNYSSEDLTRLELIVIQELIKKIEKIEEKIFK